jgi:hypothetical protein
MALGVLGIGYGFLTAPKDIQEVEMILAAESHGEHGELNMMLLPMKRMTWSRVA